jgi:hypothetical protein
MQRLKGCKQYFKINTKLNWEPMQFVYVFERDINHS